MTGCRGRMLWALLASPLLLACVVVVDAPPVTPTPVASVTTQHCQTLQRLNTLWKKEHFDAAERATLLVATVRMTSEFSLSEEEATVEAYEWTEECISLMGW